MKKQILLSALLVVCFALALVVREKASVLHKEWERKSFELRDKQRLVPTRSSSVGLTEFLSSGMKPMIADVYWTKATTIKADELFAIQKDMGTTNMPHMLIHASTEHTRSDDYQMYELIRSVGIFDPTFEYAFFYGGHLLSFNGNTDLAISLLQDGLSKNPKSSMIPSTLSFVYYYFLKDWKNGAYYAQLSYKNGGKYALPPKAVATMYAAGANYDLAITFINSVLRTSKDKRTKEELKKQLGYVIVEKDIDYLQNPVNAYIAANGQPPPNLEHLIKMGVLKSIPKEPFGGKYIVTRKGQVTNRPERRYSHYKEIRNYIPEGGYKVQ